MSRVLDDAFEHPMRKEEHAALLLAGGIMQHGYQCGMIWGATLAAGAQAYRLHGPGARAEQVAIEAGKRLVELFREHNSHINCLEIIDIDKSSSTWEMISFFLLKGGMIGCIRKATRFTSAAVDEVSEAVSTESGETPVPPVSCTALVARKMGASNIQATMASGFAGGIGLCGGACGALATAVWIVAMNILKRPNSKLRFGDPEATEVIGRFLAQTDFKFECSSIVGREFVSVSDHADHLRNGGCSEIIETLADSG